MRLLLVTPLLLSGCLAPLGLSPRVPEPTFVPATPLFIDAGYKGRLGQTDALLAIPAPPWEVTVNEAERAFDPPFVDDGEYQRFLRGIGALNVRFVLMLDDVSFGFARGWAAAAPPTMRSLGPGLPAVTEPGPPVYGGGAASELIASARYLIYDYPYERVVACGVARGSSSLENGRIRRLDWDVAMAELGSNVATPF
jgi:hypothetical protein